VDTCREPDDLLADLLALEQRYGRTRSVRWGPRTLDLDLLWYDGRRQATATLRLPHPEATHRRFVLDPWRDVWPDGVLEGRPLASWQAAVGDQGVRPVGDDLWWLVPGSTFAADRVAPILLSTLAARGVAWLSNPDGSLLVVDGPGLMSDAVLAAARAAWGGRDWAWHLMAEVETTMDVASAAMRRRREAVAILADRQRGGRGRRGRSWQAWPGGSLTLSLGWVPEPVELAGPLTLAAGVAVVRAVRRVTGLVPRLKWPNDGLLTGRKCFGILAESGRGDWPWVVVGFGLNVNGQAPVAAGAAVSLEQVSGRPWSRAALAVAVAEEMTRVRQAWLAAGEAEPVLAEWRRYDVTLHRPVVIHHGASAYAGVAEAVLPNGALQVRRGDGAVTTVVAADVSLRFSEDVD
jgi:BirA family biotin operon repressor/biotin-[acetyl-CoA-carboxylase] ligase